MGRKGRGENEDTTTGKSSVKLGSMKVIGNRKSKRSDKAGTTSGPFTVRDFGKFEKAAALLDASPGEFKEIIEDLRKFARMRTDHQAGRKSDYLGWVSRFRTALDNKGNSPVIEKTALLLNAMDKALGREATADECEQVIKGLQARRSGVYDQGEPQPNGEGGQGQSLPNKKKTTPDTRGAKAETTNPSVQRSRRGKRALSVYVTGDELEDFKAVAAAMGKGAQECLEEFIATTVKNNKQLIPLGKEKLKGPRRRRSSTETLEQENRRLKAQLRRVGIEPA